MNSIIDLGFFLIRSEVFGWIHVPTANLKISKFEIFGIILANSMYFRRSWKNSYLSHLQSIWAPQILVGVSLGLFQYVPWWIWKCLAWLWEGSGLQGFGLGVSHVVFLGELQKSGHRCVLKTLERIWSRA